MWNFVEPSQVQLTSIDGNKWGWAIWYGPGNHAPDARDSSGTAETLSLAMSAVQSSLAASLSRALAYD